MKKLLLIAAIGIISLAAAPAAKAQVSLSINIGSQPQWGPRGYDHVDYYYLPDVDSYYYVPTRQFVYLSGSRWIHASCLPSRYRNYDLYGGRKVIINSPNPWRRHDYYRTQYVSNNYYGRGRGDYNRGRDHDRGNGWGRGNGNGWGRGNDRGERHDRGEGHGRGDHGDRGEHGRGRGRDRD